MTLAAAAAAAAAAAVAAAAAAAAASNRIKTFHNLSILFKISSGGSLELIPSILGIKLTPDRPPLEACMLSNI